MTALSFMRPTKPMTEHFDRAKPDDAWKQSRRWTGKGKVR